MKLAEQLFFPSESSFLSNGSLNFCSKKAENEESQNQDLKQKFEYKKRGMGFTRVNQNKNIITILSTKKPAESLL